MKNPTFIFYSDPGHGWLRVSRAHLEALQLEGLISSYSYQRGKWAYLEEDCDAHEFLQAARAAGWSFTIKEKNSASNYSVIRTYAHFSARAAA